MGNHDYPGALPLAEMEDLGPVALLFVSIEEDVVAQRYFLGVYTEIKAGPEGDPNAIVRSELEEILKRIKIKQGLPEIRNHLIRYLCAEVEYSRNTAAPQEYIETQFEYAQKTLFSYLIERYRSRKEVSIEALERYEHLAAVLFQREYITKYLYTNATLVSQQLKTHALGWNALGNHTSLRDQVEQKAAEVLSIIDEQEEAIKAAIERIGQGEKQRWRKHEGAQILATVLLLAGVIAMTWY